MRGEKSSSASVLIYRNHPGTPQGSSQKVPIGQSSLSSPFSGGSFSSSGGRSPVAARRAGRRQYPSSSARVTQNRHSLQTLGCFMRASRNQIRPCNARMTFSANRRHRFLLEHAYAFPFVQQRVGTCQTGNSPPTDNDRVVLRPVSTHASLRTGIPGMPSARKARRCPIFPLFVARNPCRSPSCPAGIRASRSKGPSPHTRRCGEQVTAYPWISPDTFHFSWKTISSNGFRGGPDLPASCG